MSLCVILYTSCATSQNATIIAEAEKKVSNIKPMIGLSDTQAEKMIAIETEYLKETKKLTYSSAYNNKLKELKEKRSNQIKEVLSRDQYIKFDMIDNNRIKKVPIRAD